MTRRPLLRFVASLATIISLGSAAHAQGGSCKDPWINNGFNYLYGKAPVGTGVYDECSPLLYGHGHWTNYNDLLVKMQQAFGPATTAAARSNAAIRVASAPSPALVRPAPSAAGPESLRVAPGTVTQLGTFSSAPANSAGFDPDLNHRPSAMAGVKLNRGSYSVNGSGDLVDSSGRIICRAGSYSLSPTGAVITSYAVASGIVAQGGGNIVAQGGGNIVAQGGGNIVAQGGGNIVAQGGGNLIPAAGMRVNISN